MLLRALEEGNTSGCSTFTGLVAGVLAVEAKVPKLEVDPVTPGNEAVDLAKRKGV
jgi:hypothetical protein